MRDRVAQCAAAASVTRCTCRHQLKDSSAIKVSNKAKAFSGWSIGTKCPAPFTNTCVKFPVDRDDPTATPLSFQGFLTNPENLRYTSPPTASVTASNHASVPTKLQSISKIPL